MTEFAKAQLTPITTPSGENIPVTQRNERTLVADFNPETLEVSVRSQLKEDRGRRNNKTPLSVVESSEASLSVQLVFDETISGLDVRIKTQRIEAMMRPTPRNMAGYGEEGRGHVMLPQMVQFAWGSFFFEGIISDCAETLDYFSASGVPLRATIKLTIQDQRPTFTAQTAGGQTNRQAAMTIPQDTSVPRGNNASANHDMARANNVENLRRPETNMLFAGSETGTNSIRGALGNASAATASGSSGKFGLPAKAVATAKAGFSIGAGAGVKAGVKAGLGGSNVGLNPLAGLSANTPTAAHIKAKVGADIGLGMDAFAKLQPPKINTGASSVGAHFGASASAGFSMSGGASAGQSGQSAQAEVGAKLDLSAILFQED